MIAKFKTEEGWRYFDKVTQANLLNPEAAKLRKEGGDRPDYELGGDIPAEKRKVVDLLIPEEGWVSVEFSREAYLCSDRGETINAI